MPERDELMHHDAADLAARGPSARPASGASAEHEIVNVPSGLGVVGWRAALPFVLSVAVHAALIAGAVGVVWQVAAPAPEPAIAIETDFFDPQLGGAEPTPATADPLDQAADRALTLPESAAEPLPELAELPAPDAPQLDEAPPPAFDASPQRDLPASLREQKRLERRFPEIRFGGLGAGNARDVVYVVDASGSMVSAMPMVRAMLERSVRRLAPTQRFQIVFFQNAAHVAAPHPQDRSARQFRLIRATHDNIDAALDWARRVEAGGRSDPVPALRFAFGFDPDAIFVLSKAIAEPGAWDPDVDAILSQLDRMNPIDRRSGHRRVAIKTIQLMESDPAGVLRAIGEAHGGDEGYTFLSRDELQRRLAPADTPTDDASPLPEPNP
jgi:hypothetical protein